MNNEMAYGGYVRLTEDNLQPVDLHTVEGFVIDSDSKAEWALKKIKEAQDERDRLLALVLEERVKLQEQQEKIERRYANDTEYLQYLLYSYFQTVKTKETKTQRSYRLLSGSIVEKKPSYKYNVDNDVLAAWLHENGHDELTKTTVTPRWADVKKLLSFDEDTGIITIAATGEAVDGVTAEAVPSEFTIKFN